MTTETELPTLIEPIEHRVRNGDVTLRVLEWPGDDTNHPAIVCLHALGLGAWTWLDLASRLAPRHRVLALDMRGHGESAAPESGYAFADQISDVQAVLAECGIAPPILIGHSMGARQAVATAVMRPNLPRALVLIDSGAGRSRDGAATIRNLERLDDGQPSLPAYLDFMCSRSTYRSRTPAIERFLIEHANVRPDGTVTTKVDSNAFRQTVWSTPRAAQTLTLDQIRCPVLVIRPERGNLADETFAAMQERIADVRWRSVPHAGHYVPLTHPAAVAAVVEEFLTELGE